jgi:hypothetical protein
MYFDILNTSQIKPSQTVDWTDFAGKESVLITEKKKREAFTTTFINTPDVISIEKNVKTVQALESGNNKNVSTLLKNNVDLSNNIQTYLDTQSYLSMNNSKYHYDDVMEPGAILKKESPDNITTVLEKDLNTLNLYQNSIYISSAIACATLLIAAIIIVPLQKNS